MDSYELCRWHLAQHKVGLHTLQLLTHKAAPYSGPAARDLGVTAPSVCAFTTVGAVKVVYCQLRRSPSCQESLARCCC
jgi:hypothetical protein